MRAANAGDGAAYQRLLAAAAVWLRPLVRSGLARAGRSIDDAEDVVQETLIAMHLKRATWDATKPVEPWLRAIARHKLIDHLRRRGFHDHVDIDALAETLGESSGADLARDIDRDDMLGRLPARQREIVAGMSIEGLSAREMGERLGMSEGAVRVALHRALKALGAAYRDRGE